jgi:hypothetical protein
MKLQGHFPFPTLRGNRYQSSDQNSLFIEVGNTLRGEKEKRPCPKKLLLRDLVEGEDLVAGSRQRRLYIATAVLKAIAAHA